MGIILEIRNGPTAGKIIGLTKGQSVTIGRAAGKATFALAEDTFMSGLHFAVECGPSGCRVVDRKSSNGTFLNGARIQDAILANSDEIKAGKTVFHVKIVPDEKIAAMDLPQQRASRPKREASGDADSPGQGGEGSAGERPRRQEPSAPPASRDVEPSVRPRASAPPPGVPEPAVLGRISEALSPRGAPEIPAPPASDPLPRAEEHRADANAQLSVPPVEAVLPREKPETPASENPVAGQGRQDAVGREPSAGSVEHAAKDFAPVAEPPLKSGPRSFEEPPRVRESVRPPVEAERSGRAVEPSAGGRPAPIAASPLERRGSRHEAGARNFAFSVMGWSFPAAPTEWQVQEGFGLQRAAAEEFPSSVAVTEEALAGITLQQFVESQIGMLRGYLRDPKIEPTMPPRVDGADESMGMDVRHSTKDGTELAYRHIYARSGPSVGILTVTTLASEFPQVIESLQPLLDGAAFRATVHSS